MTLQESTAIAQTAIRSGDLDALADALRLRAEAIEDGAVPSSAVLEAGDKAMAELAALKQKLALENSRLEQVRAGLIGTMPARQRLCVDYFA